MRHKSGAPHCTHSAGLRLINPRAPQKAALGCKSYRPGLVVSTNHNVGSLDDCVSGLANLQTQLLDGLVGDGR